MSMEPNERTPLFLAAGSKKQEEKVPLLDFRALARIVGALSAGKLPTNPQLLTILASVSSSPIFTDPTTTIDLGLFKPQYEGGELTQKRARLARNVKEFIGWLERAVRERNGNDKFQRLIFSVSQSNFQLLSTRKLVPPHLPSPSQDIPTLSSSFRSLLLLILTSSVFRQFIKDGVFILMALVGGDGGDEDDDKKVEKNYPHPAAVPKSNDKVKKSRAQEAGERLDAVRVSGDTGTTEKDFTEASEQIPPEVEVDILHPATTTDSTQTDLESISGANSNKPVADKPSPTSNKDEEDCTSSNSSDSDSDSPSESSPFANFSPRDEAIRRLQLLAIEIQQREEYSEAVGAIWEVGEKWIESLGVLGEGLEAVVEEEGPELADGKGGLADVMGLVGEVLEELVGRKLMNEVEGIVKEMKRLGEEDRERIGMWLRDFRAFLHTTLFLPTYATTPSFIRDADSLHEQFTSITQPSTSSTNIDNASASFKRLYRRLIKCLNEGLRRVAEDPVWIGLGESWRKCEESGGEMLGGVEKAVQREAGDLWKDIIAVFLPRLLGMIKTIRIPRVEYCSTMVDFSIDHAHLASPSSHGFSPALLSLQSHTDASLSYSPPTDAFQSRLGGNVILEVRGLCCETTDISYFVEKKGTWWDLGMGIMDHGLLDLKVGKGGDGDVKSKDNGFGFMMELDTTEEEDPDSFFDVKDVKVDVKNFSLKMHHTYAPVRNFFLSPILQYVMKTQLIHALEFELKSVIQMFGKGLYALHQEARRQKLSGTPTAGDYMRAFISGFLFPSERNKRMGLNASKKGKGKEKRDERVDQYQDYSEETEIPGGWNEDEEVDNDELDANDVQKADEEKNPSTPPPESTGFSTEVKITVPGIVARSPDGRESFAIGLDDQLLPGKAPHPDIVKAGGKDPKAGEESDGLGQRTKQVLKEVEGTVKEGARESLDVRREEGGKDGWKSEAFHLS